MTHYIATLTIFVVFAGMAFTAERADRYQRLADHADLGCGADEFEGHRRFTRPTDTRKPSAHSAKNPAEGGDQYRGERTSRA